MGGNVFSEGCAWINGHYVPMAEAAIPITDTGFTRSDLTYDVVSVWDGSFFRLDDHLARFEASWQQLRLNPAHKVTEMRDILMNCVGKSGLREAYVEMIVTRGAPVNGDRDPRNFANRFYAFAIPYVWIAEPALQDIGVSLIVARTTQRIPPICVNPEVKNFHWGDLVRGLFEAYDKDAYTAVLLDADGNITEGPGFNVFAVIDGALITPPGGVLQGITRATVIQLAKEVGISCATESLSADRFLAADEVFLTSTAGGVMPVTTLDNKPLGNGRPGAITTRIREAYWSARNRPEWTTAVSYRGKLESIA